MARTLVTFRSHAFNTSEPRADYVNPECYGDDLCRWLAAELKKRGIEAEDPGPEDFGWYLPYGVGDQKFNFIVSYRPDEPEGDWIGWLEKQAPLLSALFGGRHKDIPPEATGTIHAILASHQGIRDIRWHIRKDFDKGVEDQGSPSP